MILLSFLNGFNHIIHASLYIVIFFNYAMFGIGDAVRHHNL